MTNTYLLLLPPALPAIAAILVLVLRKRPAIRDCVPVIGAVLTFFSVLQLAPAVLAGQVCRASLFTLLPGISVACASTAWACCLPARLRFSG